MSPEDIVQLISTGIAVVAAGFAFMQVRSMKISSHAELLTKALDRFHSREMRDLRYRVFMAANKPLPQWTNDEYLAAEEVANYFAEIGFLMKNGYLEEAAFLDYWGIAVMRSFHACHPMIEVRRSADRRAELVDLAGEPRATADAYVYFEWLARRAFQNSERKQWWRGRKWRKAIESTSRMLDGRFAVRPGESAREAWRRETPAEDDASQAS